VIISDTYKRNKKILYSLNMSSVFYYSIYSPIRTMSRMVVLLLAAVIAITATYAEEVRNLNIVC